MEHSASTRKSEQMGYFDMVSLLEDLYFEVTLIPLYK